MDVILTEMGGRLVKIFCDKASRFEDGLVNGVMGESVWYVGFDEDHYFITEEEQLDDETEREIKKLLAKYSGKSQPMHKFVRITGAASIVFSNE